MLNSRNLNASSDRWRFFYGVELQSSSQPQWGQCQGFWGVAIGISQVGHRWPPNLVVAETIGRTEGLLLHRELVRIDPANRVRYAVCHYGSLTLAEAGI
jgi:hypothetical protein